MKIIEQKDNQIVFTAEVNESVANAIRRYIYQVPILAVDELEIYKNDSPLYDETIAHRMGLIPLRTSKSIKEKTKAELKLNVNKEGMVYSGDMTGDAKVVYDEIPITSLNKGQELELTAIAKVGRGSEHSKFSAGLLFYRNVVEITTDSSLREKIRSASPDNEIIEKGNEITIIDNRKKEILDICEEICRENGKKPNVEFKDDLVITLESFGQMDVKDLLLKALDVFKKDLAGVSKKIK